VKENYFTTSFIDRAADKRSDDKWIYSKINDDNSRFILIRNENNLFGLSSQPLPIYLSKKDFHELKLRKRKAIFLGTIDKQAYFAVDLNGSEFSPAYLKKMNGAFIDLKKTTAALPARDSALLAYARAMVYWHSRQKYCGRCGSPTLSKEAGNLLQCNNEQCGQPHFPRTDPAIIVLASDGERCLLGSQPPWPENMFSTIAGFVEPGESLEQAVKREVQEETNIKVTDIKYISSQPWSFPSSLMLGFSAKAVSDDIKINDNELEEVRWFSRQEMVEGLQNGTLKLSSPFSIAYRLINDWFDLGELGELKTLYGHRLK